MLWRDQSPPKDSSVGFWSSLWKALSLQSRDVLNHALKIPCSNNAKGLTWVSAESTLATLFSHQTLKHCERSLLVYQHAVALCASCDMLSCMEKLSFCYRAPVLYFAILKYQMYATCGRQSWPLVFYLGEGCVWKERKREAMMLSLFLNWILCTSGQRRWGSGQGWVQRMGKVLQHWPPRTGPYAGDLYSGWRVFQKHFDPIKGASKRIRLSEVLSAFQNS